MTLDEALGELNAVTSKGIQQLAVRLIRDDLLRLAAITPRGRGRGLEALLKLPGGKT